MRAYAFDLDGTVYLGDELLPGAAEAIARLRGQGSGVVFVTNNPLHSETSYADKLSRLGIPTTARDVVTSVHALVGYLGRRYPRATVLTVAESVVERALASAGHRFAESPQDAAVVVVSFDRTFDYRKLHAAYRAVRAGAVIVATNPDPYCPTPDGGLPDCAAMLAAIEACTGARAEAVVGKPSRYMADAILDRLGVPAADVTMVGDRLLTDVAMARAAGMAGTLVLTGATTPDDLAGAEIRPDHVISTLGELR
jgi:NagD protein